MYKPIFALCLLLCSFAAFSQKIHITDSGNVWKYSGFDPDGNPWGVVAGYGGDTVINSLSYKKIVTSYYNPCTCLITQPGQSACSCTPGQNGISTGFIREDTAAGKVYCYSPAPYSGYDTMEHVLYDYNLQPGDILNPLAYNTSIPATPFFDSVAKVDSFLYLANYYRVITLFSRSQSIANCHYTYVEGMGCPANAFHPSYVSDCFEGGSQLVCFSVNYMAINLNFSTTYYSYNNNCFLGVPPICISNNVIVSPNPVRDELDIVSGNEENAVLKVYDMGGRCVYRGSQVGPTMTINTAEWKSGIYNVVLFTGGQSVSRKIVKE